MFCDCWTISQFCYSVILYLRHRPKQNYFFEFCDVDSSSPEIQKDEKDADSVRSRQGPVHGLTSQRRGQGSSGVGGGSVTLGISNKLSSLFEP